MIRIGVGKSGASRLWAPSGRHPIEGRSSASALRRKAACAALAIPGAIRVERDHQVKQSVIQRQILGLFQKRAESGSNPSRWPTRAPGQPSRCSCRQSVRMNRRSQAEQVAISVAGRDQFSEAEGENTSDREMPSSLAARTTRRNASTPRR